jgi:flavin-dependent dehydrogenase
VRDCDVLVLGGGPAGLATGIALSRLGRSVVVLERTRYERPRAGETFAGGLRLLLQAIGAWDEFPSIEPIPFRGVRSSWGAPELSEHSSAFQPFEDGWHVDRARFDRLLVRCAERAGVVVEQGAGSCSLTWSEGRWRARPEAGDEVSGRLLVDASGRGAPASALHIVDRRWRRADRQIALLGTMTKPARAIEPTLLLEAVEDGWWYSVPQPEGALLAVLVTDGDLLPARGRSALAEHFSVRLGRSVHTAERAAGATLSAQPWIVRSDSGLLVPDRGRAWRAVGDAAMACDPLAGDGVLRALRAAIEAAPEIDRQLADPDAAPTDAETMPDRFRAYLELRGRYYQREARWPDSPFWARRRPIDFQAAPLFLDPLRVLQWDGAPLPRERVAPVEGLIPLYALRALLARLRNPMPAHQALAFLRSAAPVGDRQLLVGLQQLVALGCLSPDG